VVEGLFTENTAAKHAVGRSLTRCSVFAWPHVCEKWNCRYSSCCEAARSPSQTECLARNSTGYNLWL